MNNMFSGGKQPQFNVNQWENTLLCSETHFDIIPGTYLR